jgi:hypothetical protein
MSSKSRRRRERELRRERERERELEERHARLAPDHVACADADLAVVTALLEDALEVLHELATSGAQLGRQWPSDPEVGELRVALEEVREAALGCRDRLGAVHDRIQRLRQDDDHFHLVGERVVRMAAVEVARSEDAAIEDDIPF